MTNHHETHRTNAETILASALRKRKIHLQQNQIIEGFEVDILLPKFNLIIEVDGFIHLSRSKQASDNYKDQCLIKKGYTVFRFDNQQIRDELGHCLTVIESYIANFSKFKCSQSINDQWKEGLKKIPIRKPKSKSAPKSIEDYFLSLDDE